LESKSEISNNNGISGELAPKTKKTAKLIDADPFVLGMNYLKTFLDD
jgi:hypothetical protein